MFVCLSGKRKLRELNFNCDLTGLIIIIVCRKIQALHTPTLPSPVWECSLCYNLFRLLYTPGTTNHSWCYLWCRFIHFTHPQEEINLGNYQEVKETSLATWNNLSANLLTDHHHVVVCDDDDDVIKRLADSILYEVREDDMTCPWHWIMSLLFECCVHCKKTLFP